MGYNKLGGDVHVWLRSSGRIAQGELQQGLKQLPVIWNREVGHRREVADTWVPVGKSSGTEQNWPH